MDLYKFGQGYFFYFVYENCTLTHNKFKHKSTIIPKEENFLLLPSNTYLIKNYKKIIIHTLISNIFFLCKTKKIFKKVFPSLKLKLLFSFLFVPSFQTLLLLY